MGWRGAMVVKAPPPALRTAISRERGEPSNTLPKLSPAVNSPPVTTTAGMAWVGPCCAPPERASNNRNSKSKLPSAGTVALARRPWYVNAVACACAAVAHARTASAAPTHDRMAMRHPPFARGGAPGVRKDGCGRRKDVTARPSGGRVRLRRQETRAIDVTAGDGDVSLAAVTHVVQVR